eukprot:9484707-Pyramimonas_sp.AAC.1
MVIARPRQPISRTAYAGGGVVDHCPKQKTSHANCMREQQHTQIPSRPTLGPGAVHTPPWPSQGRRTARILSPGWATVQGRL